MQEQLMEQSTYGQPFVEMNLRNSNIWNYQGNQLLSVIRSKKKK